WIPGNGNAVMLPTENQVSALVTHALGVTTTTGDTMSLARDPATDELLFTVQSPTAQDATVFSTAGGGTVVAGHAEADFGFTGSPECDALDVPLWSFPSLTVSTPAPAAGANFTVSIAGAQPNAPYVVLAAFDT